MYKVLIAEDEALVRIGLKSIINWADLDMEVVGDVSNGKQALEIFHQYHPDIILTDIKMPVMDGLELIRNIRQQSSHTKIVILTCYEEFAYLHEAMKLDISDYILKLKMMPSDLNKTLSRLKHELDDTKKADQAPSLAGAPQNIKEKILKQYVFYRHFSKEEFAGIINAMGIRIACKHIFVCKMRILNYADMQARFQDPQGYLVQYAVINIAEEILSQQQWGEVIWDRDDSFIFFFSFPDTAELSEAAHKLEAILSLIEQPLWTYLKSKTVFGISESCDSYENLHQLYDQASTALEGAYFIDETLLYSRQDNAALQQALLGQVDVFCARMAAEASLPTEQTLALRVAVEQAATERLAVCEVFLWWLQEAMEAHHPRQSDKPLLSWRDRLFEQPSLRAMLAEGASLIAELTQDFNANRPVSPESRQAVHIIRGNMAKKLTLQWVAQQIGLSPNYLSTLFKKELGINFVDYINQQRVEKAKRLLRDTNDKTLKIARDIGFYDESYFSRTFKRITGLRPHEYRRKYSAIPADDAVTQEEAGGAWDA